MVKLHHTLKVHMYCVDETYIFDPGTTFVPLAQPAEQKILWYLYTFSLVAFSFLQKDLADDCNNNDQFHFQL